MTPRLWRLVVAVSCAHALVHVFELAFPSVEQLIAHDFDVGKRQMGIVASCFRVPFGGFAILAGWLVDRYGPRRILNVYMVGCGLAALGVSQSQTLPAMYVSMLSLGTLASLYHPAGLAYLSIEVPRDSRPRALGLHGILGSAGIGAAPFVAGAALSVGIGWQGYYAGLALVGVGLGLAFLAESLVRRRRHARHPTAAMLPEQLGAARWKSFFIVTAFGTLNGFIYAAYLTFLPRYLDAAGTAWFSSRLAAEGNFLTGLVLLCGMFGQYLGGRTARHGWLEWTLAGVALGTVPFLIAMALVHGAPRLVAAAGFAVVHFMAQPVYNTLIAEYVPRRRRSVGYGFSFMMTFGVGGLGSAFAGFADRWAGPDYGDRYTYGALALTAVLASLVAAVLARLSRVPQRG